MLESFQGDTMASLHSLFISILFLGNLAFAGEKVEAKVCQDTGTCYINSLAKNLENAMYENGGKRSHMVDPTELIRQYADYNYNVKTDKDGKIKDPAQLHRVMGKFKKDLNEVDDPDSSGSKKMELLGAGGFSHEVWESLVNNGGKVPYYKKEDVYSQGSGIYGDGGQQTDDALTEAQRLYGDKSKGIYARQADTKLPKRKIKSQGELDLSQFSFTHLDLKYGDNVYWGKWADAVNGGYPENIENDSGAKAEIDRLREEKNKRVAELFDQSLGQYKGGFVIGMGSTGIYDNSTGELKKRYEGSGAHAINVIDKKVINGKTYYVLDDTNPTLKERDTAPGKDYKNSEKGVTLLPADELYKVTSIDQVTPKHLKGGLPDKVELTAFEGHRVNETRAEQAKRPERKTASSTPQGSSASR